MSGCVQLTAAAAAAAPWTCCRRRSSNVRMIITGQSETDSQSEGMSYTHQWKGGGAVQTLKRVKIDG